MLRHCRSKFTDDRVDSDYEDALVLKYEQLAVGQQLCGSIAPPLLLHDIFYARLRQNSGSFNGGKTGIVPEWLKALPIVLVYCIWSLFVARYECSNNQEYMSSWIFLEMCFLKKERDATKLSLYRGICLLDASPSGMSVAS